MDRTPAPLLAPVTSGNAAAPLSDQRAAELLDHAVFGHREGEPGGSAAARPGLLDRWFASWFKQLVYTQIWEDPRIDREVLEIQPGHRVLTLASGGCNALSYLLDHPAEVIALDLNHNHLALVALKQAAARALPDAAQYQRFFAGAADDMNVALFDELIAPQLSPEVRAYWNQRDALGRRRIGWFARGFYTQGLLGRFVRAARLFARLHGVRLSDWAEQRTEFEQATWFDSQVAPIFDTRFARWVCSSPLIVYNLGIPPAQYLALCNGRPETMAEVLKARARQLATVSAREDNYFAWQAFTGGYAWQRLQQRAATAGHEGPLPPYLQRAHFETLRANAHRLKLKHDNVLDHLAAEASASLDRYVLLDAQDWMSAAQLTRLWTQITRTARPGARVIFRTAGTTSPLPDALPPELLAAWERIESASALNAEDRSGIYGGFFAYTLRQVRG